MAAPARRILPDGLRKPAMGGLEPLDLFLSSLAVLHVDVNHQQAESGRLIPAGKPNVCFRLQLPPPANKVEVARCVVHAAGKALRRNFCARSERKHSLLRARKRFGSAEMCCRLRHAAKLRDSVSHAVLTRCMASCEPPRSG